MWKKASVVIPGHHLLKRRHHLSPLTSSQVDEQTAFQIKKKGYRIPFENVPIRPRPPALVMSSKEAAFQFLQRERVSRYTQLLSVQLSKTHVATILRHLGNLLLIEMCTHTYIYNVCHLILYKTKKILIVANWPHLGAL